MNNIVGFSLIIGLLFVGNCAHAMGKLHPGPLIENKFQLAEQMKLADEIAGVKSKIDKVEAKVDGQAVAMAGFNNTVSKVSSEMKLVGNNNQVNDAEIFKEQLRSQKELAKVQLEAAKDRENTNKKTIYWLIGVIILLVNQLFKYFNKYMEYKEGFLKNLPPEIADAAMDKLHAERAKKTVFAKVKKMIVW